MCSHLSKYDRDYIGLAVDARSLNLSNAAAILIYEALRKHGFPGLEIKGPGLE